MIDDMIWGCRFCMILKMKIWKASNKVLKLDSYKLTL
jgi:hypothetical protein